MWPLDNYKKKMQIKTTMRYQFPPTRKAKIKRTDILSVGENVGKLEVLYTTGGDVKWCHHSGKQAGHLKNKVKYTLTTLLSKLLISI